MQGFPPIRLRVGSITSSVLDCGESVIMFTEKTLQKRVGMMLLLVSAAGLVAGCSKAKQPWEIVYPAKGVVSLNGEPLAGARITLIPEDEKVPDSVRPSATSNEDGTFSLGTYSLSDGAPAGNFKVLVLHFPVVGPKDNPTAGKNDLPPKYSKPDSTDLTVAVDPSPTDLALELKK